MRSPLSVNCQFTIRQKNINNNNIIINILSDFYMYRATVVIIGVLSIVASSADPCAPYGGKEHAQSDGVCCVAVCGEFCGGSKANDCDHGPGGGDACCASHIRVSGRECGAGVDAPCLLFASPQISLADDFTTRNDSMWTYANEKLAKVEDGVTWYLKNHSAVNIPLSSGEGRGMGIVCNDQPCVHNPSLCHGALTASDHVHSVRTVSYGEHRLRFRPPYNANNTSPDEVYAYFTAGYATGKPAKTLASNAVHAEKNVSWWNEMNFGFRNDARGHGPSSHVVSCEWHADTGHYEEFYVDLGFDFRDGFHTYVLQHRVDSLTWIVDGRVIHSTQATLSHEMGTSLIVRSNGHQAMSEVRAEYAYYSFVSY